MLANKAGLFSPGLFARVRVTGSANYAALLLPDEAIGTDQTNKYRLRRRRGRHGGAPQRQARARWYEGLRVVREGVSGEDWVITKGLQRARPGLKVAPKREALAVSRRRRPQGRRRRSE